jgi:chemotaxis protein MotB
MSIAKEDRRCVRASEPRRTRRSIAIVALGVSLLFGCGVSQAKHDQVVKDAADARARADTSEKRVAELRAEVERLRTALRQAEEKGTSDQTRAELEELRKQKAAVEARLRVFEEFLEKFKAMIDAGRLKVVVRRGQIVLVMETDVLFDLGKTEIKKEGKAALAELAATLRTVKDRNFQVAGHTDTTRIVSKEFASNWELSTARALVVVHFLIARGVGKKTLSAAGYGEFDPIDSNGTAAGRAKNRRIEIMLQPNIEDLVALPALAP